VLEATVAPVVLDALHQVPLERWGFIRWVDGRGPHLRLALCAETVWGTGAAEGIGEQLRAGLPAAQAAPVRDPVLAPPKSLSGPTPVGVEIEPFELAAVGFGPRDDADGAALSQVSSETVLRILPSLPRGHERLAYGLALLATLSSSTLAPERRGTFWGESARSWVGQGQRARQVLDKLLSHGQRLQPELVSTVLALTESDGPGAALRRYADACEGLREVPSKADHEARVRRHAHLTSNRLGVNAFEEALLATILAEGVELARATTPSSKPEGSSSDAEPTTPAALDEDALVVSDVSKHNEDGTVLDGVSFTVREGEVFGLLGPEGAGKSSLIGIAAGLRIATSGSVRLLGQDPSGDRRELAADIGMAVPDDDLAPEATVRENLELRALALRSSGVETGSNVDAALDLIDLRAEASEILRELGHVARRLVALGVGLMAGPRVVFLDEATADLSPVERESIWAVIERLRVAQTTVVLSTSSLQEVRTLCDRAALVVGGSLLAVDEPEALTDEHFPERSLTFDTLEEPDRALLAELPEIESVRIEQRDERWRVELSVLQPDQVLRLLGADPDFPEIVYVALEDLEHAFVHTSSTAMPG
jgi:ABC-2 type transport system ATP-binding protein